MIIECDTNQNLRDDSAAYGPGWWPPALSEVLFFGGNSASLRMQNQSGALNANGKIPVWNCDAQWRGDVRNSVEPGAARDAAVTVTPLIDMQVDSYPFANSHVD